MKRYRMLCLLLGAAAFCAATADAGELFSYALVQDDSSLRIKGNTVHLFGIYVPPTNRNCRTNIRPTRCASRTALALDFKIQGFVRCEPRQERADGSIEAVCYVGSSAFSAGEDLGAYLVQQGLALALPEAPFEYHALERIARHNLMGVWGFAVDSVEPAWGSSGIPRGGR